MRVVHRFHLLTFSVSDVFFYISTDLLFEEVFFVRILTVHQVRRKLVGEKPAPVFLPEGLNPVIAHGSLSHFYGISPEQSVDFRPIERGKPLTKGGLVAQVPLCALGEKDPKSLILTFRVVN